MEDDDGDECAVEVAAFGDGDAAVRWKDDEYGSVFGCVCWKRREERMESIIR